MACLAVNTNGDRLTEDFTITETSDKVYTVSSNFTLVETPDVDLTIDIVYTPYFDLLFSPTFYHNTLYADGVNGGSSTEARIVKSPANIYFDETEMTIKPNDENGTVTFYVDSFSAINKYITNYISMIQRYVNLADWTNYDFKQSQLYNYWLPCFDEEQYNSIITNLIASGKNVKIVNDKTIIAENRDYLYPIYITDNPDNVLTFNKAISVDTMNMTVGFQFLSAMILNTTQDYLINLEDKNIYSQAQEWWLKTKSLLATQLLYASDSGTTQDNYLIKFGIDITAVKSVYQLDDTKRYNVDEIFEKYYIPKDAQSEGDGSRQLTFTVDEWEQLLLTAHMLDESVDKEKTKTDNYLITTTTTRNNQEANKIIFVPTTQLPFFPHQLFILS